MLALTPVRNGGRSPVCTATSDRCGIDMGASASPGERLIGLQEIKGSLPQAVLGTFRRRPVFLIAVLYFDEE